MRGVFESVCLPVKSSKQIARKGVETRRKVGVKGQEQIFGKTRRNNDTTRNMNCTYLTFY